MKLNNVKADVEFAREEVRIQMDLKHDNIIRIYAVSEIVQHNYVKFDIILEYADSKLYIYIYIYIIFDRRGPR